VLEIKQCIMACRRHTGSEALGCVTYVRVLAKVSCRNYRESRLALKFRGRRCAKDLVS
jgi:hypothetical protein